MARVIAAVLVVGFGTMAFAGGLIASPSAEPTVESFLLDWQQRHYQAAAALTTGNPVAVASAMRGAYQQLDAAAFYLSMGHVTQRGASASAHFQAWVDLGQDGAPWKYNGTFTLRRAGSTWRVVWSPSVINPALKPGYRLAVRSSAQARQQLLDSSGTSLENPSGVWQVGVQPDQLRHPRATADGLGRITRLDPTQLLGWIRAAPGSHFQELVELRPSQYKRMAGALHRVPGLVFHHEHQRLFNSIAPAVVGQVDSEASAAFRDEGIAYRPGATIGRTGLQFAYQRQLAGTPTTEVVLETAAGRQVSVLARWQGSTARPVQTTIDGATQQAAVKAVGAAAPVSSAVVAVQASTGHVLAVADQRGRGMPRIDPLNGRYPPGAAFTMVSAQALLTRQVPLNRPMLCPAINWIGGRRFKNVPPVSGLGMNATFATDFAHACSSAFVGLSEVLRPADLNAAADQFGLGASWGGFPVPAFSGSVRASGGMAALAADTIGQGDVLVSPLAMAVAAARVDSGTWRSPSLVLDPSAGSSAGAQQGRGATLSAGSLDSLRNLLGAAARTSGATAANRAGQTVFGQTGAAPFTTGKKQLWASWFVGYRGDVAIAVLEFSRTDPVSAVPLATRFLHAIGS